MIDLQTLAAPIPPGGIETVLEGVTALQGDLGHVVVWWQATGSCFSGVAHQGQLLTWVLFLACDEASALQAAREQFDLAMWAALQAAEHSALEVSGPSGRVH